MPINEKSSVAYDDFTKLSKPQIERGLKKLAGAKAVAGGFASEQLEAAITNARTSYISALQKESNSIKPEAAEALAAKLIAEAEEDGRKTLRAFTRKTVSPVPQLHPTANVVLTQPHSAETTTPPKTHKPIWGDTLSKLSSFFGLTASAKTAANTCNNGDVKNRDADLVGAVAIAYANQLPTADQVKVGVTLNAPTQAQIASVAKEMCGTVLADGKVHYLNELRGKPIAQLLPNLVKQVGAAK